MGRFTVALIVALLSAGPAEGLPLPLAPPASPRQEHYVISLAPPGATIASFQWAVQFHRDTEGTGSVYIPAVPIGPIVGQSEWDAGGGYPNGPVTLGMLVTTSDVVAVSVDGGAALPTQPLSPAPNEFRSLFFEIRGLRSAEVKRRTARFRLEYTAFAANGSPIPISAAPPSPPSPALETRLWKQPAKPAHGVCEIETRRFRGLVPFNGAVVSVLRPLRGVPGEPYLTCATTAYTYNGAIGLEAYVLINATDPRSRAAPVPGVEPVPMRPGVYQSLLWFSESTAFVARRVGGAWLVVTGGTTLQQRLSLVSDLSVRLHIGRR